MSEREVYPDAPVVYVAIEARHPDAAPLDPGQQSEIKRLVSSVFPLPQPLQNQKITATPGAPPSIVEELLPRFATRDQSTAVTFAAQAVIVETTKHETFEHLLDLLRAAVAARQEVAPVEGLLRLGLRYVDEIRVPELSDDPTRWQAWVDPSLLGPALIGAEIGLVPQQWQGATVFDRGEGRQLILRYGPREGFAVAPGALLQRPTPAPGPFFLLDIDSFWAATGDVPEFTATEVTKLCADLHDPVSHLFESLITERLRQEVLRRA